MIPMSQLHQRFRTADTEGDWVTMGVIVGQSDPRTSAKVSFCFHYFMMYKSSV